MSRHRLHKLPFVLEIAPPRADSEEGKRALFLWKAAEERRALAKEAQKSQQEMDALLDKIARELWEDHHYWYDHGVNPPHTPYPGLKRLRELTTFNGVV